MNILFLTISRIDSVSEKNIYTDLMCKFRDKGHNVFIVSPLERQFKKHTYLKKQNGVSLLKVRSLNLQKTNFIEKGIGTILLEYQFDRAIKKYFKNVQFDIVLYSTPPITFTKVIIKIKVNYNASSYLLLKDIFPQNAVDLKLLRKKSLLYRFFRKKENQMYEVSDFIGCMSQANVDYLKKHNPEIPIDKIEICPNSIELKKETFYDKEKIREKFNIPLNATVFVYGGNLGKPQGLDFLKNILNTNKNKNDRYFLIVGSGTEFNKINKWFKEESYSNASLYPVIPKDQYEQLVQACDVGLIFLDKCFSIPNYPSRLLSYLEFKLPILAATDLNTDIGKIAEENEYGYWCENGDIDKFNDILDIYCSNPDLRIKMGRNGFDYLKENFTVDKAYEIIMKHF